MLPLISGESSGADMDSRIRLLCCRRYAFLLSGVLLGPTKRLWNEGVNNLASSPPSDIRLGKNLPMALPESDADDDGDEAKSRLVLP